MNILCLSDSRLMGGAENQMLELFKRLTHRGHTVRIVCAGARFAEVARDAGLDAHLLPGPPAGPGSLASAVREVRRHARLAGARLLHAVGVRPAVVAALARRGMSPSPGLVVTVHNLTRPRPWTRALATLILRATGCFLTTVSESERRAYIAHGFPAARCRTIYNGQDVPASPAPESRRAARLDLGLPEDACVIAVLGRLSPEKGHSLLMRALAGLGAEGASIVAVFAGEGPLRAALEAERDRLGLPDHVRFLGFLRDVRNVLCASDLLALPSRAEAFPMALLEAMSHGLPVVATRVGGVTELVNDAAVGWTVPPDDPLAMRAAIREAATNPAERRRRGAAARARVQSHFSVDRMVEETLRVYTAEEGPMSGNKPGPS